MAEFDPERAALALTEELRKLGTAEQAAQGETLLRESGTWALVDELAGSVAGDRVP